MLRFKISRPYCVFNFLETCKGVYGTSESLKQFIEANTANDPSFKKLIDEYIELNIETLFQREGFPETRSSKICMSSLTCRGSIFPHQF